MHYELGLVLSVLSLPLRLPLKLPRCRTGTRIAHRDEAAVAADAHITTVVAANHVADIVAAFRAAHAVVVSRTCNGSSPSMLLLFR